MDQPIETGSATSGDLSASSGSIPIVLDPLQQALAITAEIFPGPSAVQDEFDPENPADKWRTIVVHAKGSISDIVDRKSDWHKRMIAALGPSGMDITIRVFPEES